MERIENERINTGRGLLQQRLKEKYPELDFENEDALFGRIHEDYDDFDKRLNDYKEREKKLADMFVADPRSANFLMNWVKGSNPIVELVKLFGVDGLKQAMEDEKYLEDIANANTEYLERVQKSKQLEEEFEKNIEQSLKDIENINEDEKEIDKAVEWISKLASDAQMGIYTPQNIKMAIKALTFEEKITEAEYIGEVRGRNAKIEERLRRPQGDGTAHLGSRNVIVRQERKADSIFDIAEGAR